MNTFQINEKVAFLHEQGQGIVKGYKSQNELIIEDETGFECYFHISDVIKIHSNDFNLGRQAIPDKDEVVQQNKMVIYEREEQIYGNTNSSKFWEIDLHIEEIVDSHRGMNNAEILKRQLSEFRSFYAKAIRYRIPKIIVIHGVGEGVLKDEIRLFLSKKEYVEYFDASFHDYGKGATEIRFSQRLFEQL